MLSPLVSCLAEVPFVIIDRGDPAFVDVVAVVVVVVEPGVKSNDVLESGNKVQLELEQCSVVKSCDRGNGPCAIANIYKHLNSDFTILS